jgi:hypothetical protein
MKLKDFWGRGPGGAGGRYACLTGPCLLSSTITLLLLAFLLLVGGCGKKLAPFPPDAVLPGKVREFRLSQEGDALGLSWLLPRQNLLGQPLTQVQGCRVLRAEIKGVKPATPSQSDFVFLADIDLAYPKVGEVRGEALLYQDRNLAPDKRYYYRVAAYDQERYPGAWSQTLGHSWGRLPRTPQGLQAVAGDRIVRLSWPPVTQLADGSPVRDLAGYRLYRRAGEEAWIRLNPKPVPGPSFQDVAVLNDVAYSYKVSALRRVGPDFLESEDSPVRTAQPEKRTPPSPILNLVAVAGEKGVELRWDPSPATDLAGYRVYRRQEGEAQFTLLTPQLLTRRPAYLDSRAQKGRIYHYYVTAVDNSRRANESIPSEEAGIIY